MASNMLQLVVATFPTEDGAKKTLGEIKDAKVKRGNAAVISKDEKGKLHIKESQDWGMGKSALVGGIAGFFFLGIGAIFGAAAGAVLAALVDTGFPDDTLQQMGKELQPDQSALVILIDGEYTFEVENKMRANGAQVVSHKMDEDFANELAAQVEATTEE